MTAPTYRSLLLVVGAVAFFFVHVPAARYLPYNVWHLDQLVPRAVREEHELAWRSRCVVYYFLEVLVPVSRSPYSFYEIGKF